MCVKVSAKSFCEAFSNLQVALSICQSPTTSMFDRDKNNYWLIFRVSTPVISNLQQLSQIWSYFRHYSCSKNLHIGVTNSCGKVFEYDSNGFQNHKTEEWGQSIIIYKSSEAWSKQWDDTLASFQSNVNWCSDNYEENNFNCFTFVIEFLRQLNCRELEDFVDKEKFCEKFVLPKIVSTNEYITIYRNVKRNCYFIKHSDKNV